MKDAARSPADVYIHAPLGHFQVDKLQSIVWNDDAFSNLVLPQGEKNLAWELVESKALSDGEMDDFIPEKGRGIIILMFGPPGVGKTYTAEAGRFCIFWLPCLVLDLFRLLLTVLAEVSEKARVPLYSLSAGNLGTSAQEVEAVLGYALELCHMWNAMLLLDEADVFLSSRTTARSGLARNELVSGMCLSTQHLDPPLISSPFYQNVKKRRRRNPRVRWLSSWTKVALLILTHV
jgi:hypothetical protein